MKLSPLSKGYIVCAISYVFAGLLFLLTCILFSFLNSFLLILIADLEATIIIFIASTIFHNASLYDPFWSITPMFIMTYWIVSFQIFMNLHILQFVLIGLTLTWSVRLTYNWLRQWKGIHHEDWRYKELRCKYGNIFWLINLTGIQLMPTFLVYLGSLSLYPSIIINQQSFSILNIIAIAVTLIAILFESVADHQLHNFITQRKDQNQHINYGLWKYSRHPNYFGEILFWWGLYLFAIGVDFSFWWMIIGPISITILFNIVSIPMMEAKNLRNKPGYTEYKREAKFNK